MHDLDWRNRYAATNAEQDQMHELVRARLAYSLPMALRSQVQLPCASSIAIQEKTTMETNYPSGGDTPGLHKDRDTSATAGSLSGKASRMRDDLSSLKSDLDALMAHASTLTETELREARDRILARFSSMRYAARGIADQAGRQFSQGREITVDYVRDKPLQSLAIAAAFGLVLGTILRRG
jgi:ElaB/YqjD/DUF883 family membrane-anchored ribosome-binding protein